MKVLDILGEPIVKGGQESFILNMYNNMDKEKIQIDVFTPFFCENEDFKENIIRNGGKVFIDNNKFDKTKKKMFKKSVSKFLDKNKYETVHIQSGSIYALTIGAKIARKKGVKNIIVHSHCGGFSNFKYNIIKILSTYYMNKYPTEYWACSRLAAEWKFPKRIIKKHKYKIMNNAIDTSKIYYSEEIREKARTRLGISGEFVFGNIGRFSLQKNHEFLIDIFEEIHRRDNNTMLILIGTGELEERIKEKVKNKNLTSSIKFLGVRTDICECLNAMDVFLLPSFFEGLPVVGVEAQATGLPVFTSTKVTNELPIKDLLFQYSLNDSAETWAENILCQSKKIIRKNRIAEIKQSNYDVKNAAKFMQEEYLKLGLGDKK